MALIAQTHFELVRQVLEAERTGTNLTYLRIKEIDVGNLVVWAVTQFHPTPTISEIEAAISAGRLKIMNIPVKVE